MGRSSNCCVHVPGHIRRAARWGNRAEQLAAQGGAGAWGLRNGHLRLGTGASWRVTVRRLRQRAADSSRVASAEHETHAHAQVRRYAARAAAALGSQDRQHDSAARRRQRWGSWDALRSRSRGLSDVVRACFAFHTLPRSQAGAAAALRRASRHSSHKQTLSDVTELLRIARRNTVPASTHQWPQISRQYRWGWGWHRTAPPLHRGGARHVSAAAAALSDHRSQECGP